MIRKIIHIDREKCNGCGLCVQACHEGAIGMVDGKAQLLREDYCDGLGDCLPVCPTGAIRFEEHESAPYQRPAEPLACGCPGTQARSLPAREARHGMELEREAPSQLMQWPVQLKLVPPNAPYFNGAHLLVAADCTAYAYAGFHNRFMRDRVTLIGCPKLDEGDYSQKLTQILAANDIKSLTVVRMEVPCCGGIVSAVNRALADSGKSIPLEVITLTTDGRIQ